MQLLLTMAPARAWVGLRTKEGVPSTVVNTECGTQSVFQEWEWRDGIMRMPLNLTLDPCYLNDNTVENCLSIHNLIETNGFGYHDRRCIDTVPAVLCEYYKIYRIF